MRIFTIFAPLRGADEVRHDTSAVLSDDQSWLRLHPLYRIRVMPRPGLDISYKPLFNLI